MHLKHILALLLLALLPLAAFPQATCNVTRHFGDFIRAEVFTHKGKALLSSHVVETERKSCVAELVNHDIRFMNYLLTHFSSHAQDDSLARIQDSTALQAAYILQLKSDTLFNRIMWTLTAKVVTHTLPKDSVGLDQLLDIAVKFFSVQKLTPEGHYAGKVCAGLNGIESTEPVRQPFFEAFCFSMILKHYESPEFNLYGEFVKAMKELYKVKLGTDPAEKLLRAQGAMYFLMRNNSPLRNMLLLELGRNGDFLPFVLR